MKRRDPRRHVVPERLPPWDPRSPHNEDFERQEYKFHRATAAGEWKQLRRAILDEGGIRPTRGINREDISQIPSGLIRHNSRFTADQVASWYGYDYVDDFADFVATVHRNYMDTKAPPRRPKRAPKIKHRRAAGRGKIVKLSRKMHPTKPAGKTTTDDGRKTVVVKAHTRSCPRG